MTKKTRTSVGSTWRYSAMPPHTPPMTLFVVLRSRRVDMCTFPSLAEFIEDRDAERRDEAQRHGRLGGDLRDGDREGRDGDETVERRRGGGVDERRRRAQHRGPDGHGGEARERRRRECDEQRRRCGARPRGERGDRLRVEVRRALVLLEAERAAEDALVDQVVG